MVVVPGPSQLVYASVLIWITVVRCQDLKNGWGKWSEDTTCSRTCGGGVQTSRRHCKDRSAGESACQGPNSQYGSCNTQPCPKGSMDFRSYQCRTYNGRSRTVAGRTQRFTWKPYYNPTSPCILICENEFGETKQLRRVVIDGTHCDKGNNFGVCVSGVCKPVGCDHKIGSVKADDNCLVCGGTGSNCETFKGTTMEKELTPESSTELLKFPEGATKLLIEITSSSPADMELVSSRGNSLTLTNAVLTFGKRSIAEFGGTMVMYTILEDGMRFSARGPINESLNLKVRFEGLSPLVKYEYSVRKGNSQDDEPDSKYYWTFGGWTTCSRKCGGGYQLRSVRCMDRINSKSVSPIMCQRDLMPDMNQTCSNGPCENSVQAYKWVPGKWFECSNPCGVGEHSRKMRCMEMVSTGDHVVAREELCSRYAGTKPVYKRVCQGDAHECPYWATGPWNECSVKCGYGRQSRQLYCQLDRSDPTSVPVLLDHAKCQEDQPKTKQICELDACKDGSNSERESIDTTEDNDNGSVDCTRTRYGCCPDQVSSAKGRSNQGCVDTVITLSDPCEMKKDSGTCRDYVIKWYYDPTINRCDRFWYGGCAGNDNRFADNSTCIKKCFKGDRKDMTCRTVRFGCCEDGVTFARGPNRDGCPERNRIGGCSGTRHGCCKDGVTSARGPNKAGCPETTLVGGCSGTRHGCCKDGVTSARGPNKAGCPETTLVGGCSGTRHGCCKDGVTSARGPNKAGCSETTLIGGCAGTRHGCCKDGVTPARGPNKAGCSETTLIGGCAGTQHGCCDDGATAARGPKKAGCTTNTTVVLGGCRGTRYGCCSDALTAARGPRGMGCPDSPTNISCSKSRYGCCPDSATSAKGPNKKGCPVFDPVWCGLDKDAGDNCKEYAMLWHLDKQYGSCRRFWYGGCGGNANRFSSQAECQTKCIDLKTPDACKLPVIKGPCKTSKRRFYFDNKTGKCQLFTYGGCRGNNNNFRTRDECRDACNLGPNQGRRMACASMPCQNDFTCQDYQNGTYSCSCNPDWGVNCEQPPNYWCFSDRECGPSMKCVRDKICTNDYCHVYAKCTATSDRNACDKASCPSSEDCVSDATFENGYFCIDQVKYKRPTRVLLGCGVSKYGCCPDRRTAAAGANYKGCSTPQCDYTRYGCCPDGVTSADGLNNAGCDNVDGSGDLACAQTRYGCCEDGITEAQGPNKRGCEETIDSEDRWTTTTRATTTTTMRKPSIQKCTASLRPKLCTDYTIKWGFSQDDQKCTRYWWGGCADNGNAFKDDKDCTLACITKGTEDGDTDFVNICDMDLDTGPCRGNISRYFYNYRDRRCDNFMYGGCRGNENNFITIQECQKECMDMVTSSVVTTTLAPVPETVPPPQARVNLKISGERTVDEDTELRVVCQAVGSSQVQIIWYRDGYRLKRSDDVKMQAKSSVARSDTVSDDIFSHSSEVIVPRAKPDDSGTYSCRTSDGQEKLLRVKVGGPTVTRTERPKTKKTLVMSGQLVVEEGTEFTVSCEMDGPKESTINWYLNGYPVKASKNLRMSGKSTVKFTGYTHMSEITIYRGRPEDSGTYYCRASDGQHDQMVITVRRSVRVTQAPVIPTKPVTERPIQVKSSITMNGTASVMTGETISIRCTSVGPRRSRRIEWYFDGRLVEKTSERSIKTLPDPQSRNALISEFTIENAQRKDSGAIYCRHFPYGEYKVMTVIVKDREIPVTVRPTEPVPDRGRTSGDPNVVCVMPKEIGTCRGAMPRWYYDHTAGTCMQFTYGGCAGNSNTFVSAHECESFCSATEVCLKPKVIGRCRAAVPRFYFNTNTKKCQMFTYGGCDANPNNFASHQACDRKCSPYLSRGVNVGGGDGEYQDRGVCQQPKQRGRCHEYNILWYYDFSRKTCTRFIYTGCNGNDNKFDTQAECNARCLREETTHHVTHRPQPRTTVAPVVQPEKKPSHGDCNLPKDRGTCSEYSIKWFYDANQRRCRRFYYGGCRGNNNRFDDEKSCETTCERRVIVKPTTTHLPVTVRPRSCQYSVFGCCPDGVTNALDSYKSNCHGTNVISKPGGHVHHRKVTVLPGENAHLTCSLNGQDRAWYREGILLTPESSRRLIFYKNGTLVVTRVTERYPGTYSCRTYHGNNIPQVQKFQIEVRESIKADIQSHPEMYMEGNNISLFCRGQGSPAPTVQWVKDGRVLMTGGKITVRHGELNIRSATIDDRGLYTCVATSHRGTRTNDYTMVHINPHASETSCKDTMENRKCDIIVKAGLCNVNPFRHSCCMTCRRNVLVNDAF